MVTKGKLLKGTCKNCGKTFRRKTSGELIKAIHAHYVKVHPQALSRRIKKGMKGGSKIGVKENPAWLPLLLKGIATAATVARLYGALKSKPQYERYAVRAEAAKGVVEQLIKTLDITLH